MRVTKEERALGTASGIRHGHTRGDVSVLTYQDGSRAVAKGPSPCGKFPDKDSPNHERAAYLVARLLGFRNLVPPTVLGEIRGEQVSIQRFVRGRAPNSNWDKPAKLCFFDYIIANEDRHLGNWFIKKKKNAWAIDNAYSFSCNMALPLWTTPMPHTLAARLERLLADESVIFKTLRPYLSEPSIEALISRMCTALVEGRYPP